MTLKPRESIVVPAGYEIVNLGRKNTDLLLVKMKTPRIQINRTPYPLPQKTNAPAVERK